MARRDPPRPTDPLRRDRRGLVPRRPHYSRTFYQFLPSAPIASDLRAARQYYRAVCQLLDRGGWTRGEWCGLRRLEHRWRRRVDGEDRRWNVVGVKAGRLVADLETALRPVPDPVYAVPLKRGETGEE